MFASALSDPYIQSRHATFECADRLKPGVPDHPFGLMEGISGEICFLADILHGKHVYYPGYEL